MKTKEIFDLVINEAIEKDLRGPDKVRSLLNRRKEKYENLPENKKALFDKEALVNPYMDSCIHNISEDKEIKKILVGIDIDAGELLLADKLKDIDLVIGHHPVGKGLAWLSDVMDLQIDVLNLYGVPLNQAEKITNERISEVSRSINGANHMQIIDLARLLNLNHMNVHTPVDNLAADFLKNIIEKQELEYVGDIIKVLEDVEEY
ncbi:MAG: NGG1p interacting factor NIF3, partial [Candidatus Pacebacteria bacterium]|nr:NGG1p interacting factor NIF3 [Candidatus Paceibacterota bacterium]